MEELGWPESLLPRRGYLMPRLSSDCIAITTKVWLRTYNRPPLDRASQMSDIFQKRHNPRKPKCKPGKTMHIQYTREYKALSRLSLRTAFSPSSPRPFWPLEIGLRGLSFEKIKPADTGLVEMHTSSKKTTATPPNKRPGRRV